MEITSFTRSIVHFYSYTDYFWHTGRYLGDICYRLRIILCIYCLLAFYKGLSTTIKRVLALLSLTSTFISMCLGAMESITERRVVHTEINVPACATLEID
ncbi:hypothetical protein KCV00_g417, partial [Aureobasidium melanogenum]